MVQHSLIDHTGLTGVGGSGVLNNFAASASPAVTDDSGDGYGVGSMWVDTTNDRVFIAVDVSVGAAIWRMVAGREELVAIWNQSQTKTDIGTSYVDIYTQSNSQDKWINVDFVGMKQYRVDLLWNKVGAGTQAVRVIDVTGTNNLHEFTNATSGHNASGWAAIPAAYVNTQTSIKVQAKSTTAGDDPVFEGLRVFLK